MHLTFPRVPTMSALALALPFALAVPRVASATIVDRVVAVIGDQAILLSDMRHRARPFLMQIQQKVPSAAQRAAAESEMFKELLERMVDEKLEQQAAEKAHLAVTAEEIDAGIKNVATQQNLTVEQLNQEAVKNGLSQQEYRDEIRRQILEGKLLQLRVRGRVRITDDDIRILYDRLVIAERKRQSFRISWVVLHLPVGGSAGARQEREQLAESVYRTARAGMDRNGKPVLFDTLARSFSDDTPTRHLGGDLGTRKAGELAPVIEDTAARLEVGEIAPPFVYKDAIVVMKVTSRDAVQIPPLAAAKDEVTQRAYSEQMAKARKEWLQELRGRAYVDVRF